MNEATREYIRAHREDDVRRLALAKKVADVDATFALEQIAGWQTARRKLPTWAATEGIQYPPHLSMEQCSSEQTARHKAALAQSLGTQQTTLVDLTGGLGVDFAFMAQGFERAIYVERQEHLCQLARQNLPLLGVQAEVVCADGTDYFRTLSRVGLLFLDPARRDSHGSRTYGIGDCTPNVLQLRDELMEKADHVMLKLSPMLDWRKAVSDLGEQCVSQVHIVSVGGECKELLVVMQRERGPDPLRIVCVNDNDVWEPGRFDRKRNAFWPKTECDLTQNGMRFDPKRETIWPKTQRPEAGLMLYEPNASVMKAGCFQELCQDFGVSQLAPNSHLFISAHFIDDFPGRKFRIMAVSSLNKRELKPFLQDIDKANITTRNFPLSVAELRKRLKLKDGGEVYIFATTTATGEHLLLRCHN